MVAQSQEGGTWHFFCFSSALSRFGKGTQFWARRAIRSGGVELLRMCRWRRQHLRAMLAQMPSRSQGTTSARRQSENRFQTASRIRAAFRRPALTFTPSESSNIGSFTTSQPRYSFGRPSTATHDLPGVGGCFPIIRNKWYSRVAWLFLALYA